MEFIAEIPRIIKEILYALIEISLNTCRNIVYFMELFCLYIASTYVHVHVSSIHHTRSEQIKCDIFKHHNS